MIAGFTRSILGGCALLGYAVTRVRGRWSFAQGEPQAVRGDDGQRPREPDEPAGEDVGEPVVAEEDTGQAHGEDEDRTDRDRQGALPGGGGLDEDEVDDDGGEHRGIERVAAGERR